MLLQLKRSFAVLLATAFTTSAIAAEKISINQSTFTRANQGLATETIIGLQPNNALRVKTQYLDAQDNQYTRFQQTYMGVPILWEQVVEKRDQLGNIQKLRGTRVDHIAADIGDNIKASLTELAALNLVKNANSPLTRKVDQFYEHEKVIKVIYLDENNRAHLAYQVNYFTDGLKVANPSSPMVIMDAHTGEFLEQWDALNFQDATGPGGNIKTGRYVYGEDFDPLEVDSSCRMQTENVRTVDLNFGTFGSTAYQFTCPENTTREINGAYSPLNDAHFFGGVVFDLYSEWYGTAPLTNQLVLRAHYSRNYENAFYSNGTMTFGDGATRFHPLVSLDVVSHEVSHGFTSQNSNLIYRNQSGGINEAFSDMAGEAAEYFMNGENDFKVGAQIIKAADSALRYMDEPPLDGVSIGHVDDYSSGMNVHHSSGVFNRAFYLIATSEGWDTRKAFSIFVRANQVYWGPSTDFEDGACGALESTQDLGYDINTVIDAFNVVGVVCPDFEPVDPLPVAGFSYVADFLNVAFADQSSSPNGGIVAWDWDFGDGGISSAQSPSYSYAVAGTYLVTLTVTDDDGLSASVSESITVTDGSVPSVEINLSSGSFFIWTYVIVEWDNAEGVSVDIYRDGNVIITTTNDGSYTNFIGSGSYTYQVCEQGTNVCSPEETISF